MARDAFDSASSAAGSIRDRVVSTAGQQKQNAADQVDAVADSLRRSAEAMPDEQAWLSNLTERGGEQLSDLADTLRRNDLQGLLRKVDGFARSQPALFLGASMAAGFALARVAQASVGQLAGGQMTGGQMTGGHTTGGQTGGQMAGGGTSATRPTVRTTITEGPETYHSTNRGGPDGHAGEEWRNGESTETTHG